MWRLIAPICIMGIAFAADVAAAETKEAAFRPLFNGKDLTGWNGNLQVWSVENGVIVGQSQGLPNNEFLATNDSFDDFELRVTFRLKDGVGNSGIQFRSQRIPNHHEMIGYQADVGEQYWGCLYDESRRRKVLAHPPAEFVAGLKKADWNTYTIRCSGRHIAMFLNGEKVVDYEEPDRNIEQSGVIALQVHSSKMPIRVEFKDILIRPLGKDEK